MSSGDHRLPCDDSVSVYDITNGSCQMKNLMRESKSHEKNAFVCRIRISKALKKPNRFSSNRRLLHHDYTIPERALI